MFYSLTGTVLVKDVSIVVIECGGVGFKCSTSVNTLKKIAAVGDSATLYTHLFVREDALELFGFYDLSELDCFKLLISVSGVGPKAAIAVLSELTPERLSIAVSQGDVKAITRVQGIGPKIAQRMILELKDKITTVSSDIDDSIDSDYAGRSSENVSEAVSALQFLGYSRYEASKAVRTIDSPLPVEEIIKKAIASLSENL